MKINHVFFIFSVGYQSRSLESKSVALTFSKQKIQISFLHKILSSTDLQNRRNNLYVLYQFMLRRSAINAGGKVLPYLIHCYHFMTDKWSYTLTKEEAREQDFMTFLDKYLSEYFADSKEEVLNQFGNMLCMATLRFALKLIILYLF